MKKIEYEKFLKYMHIIKKDTKCILDPAKIKDIILTNNISDRIVDISDMAVNISVQCNVDILAAAILCGRMIDENYFVIIYAKLLGKNFCTEYNTFEKTSYLYYRENNLAAKKYESYRRYYSS